MRVFVFLFFAILAIAAANRVHVGNYYNPEYNSNQVHMVDNNYESNANQVQVVDFNEDNTNEVQVVDDNSQYNPSSFHVVDNSGVPSSDSGNVVIQNPDPAFSQPSNGPSGGYEPISIEPAFVNFQNKPGKQFENPNARGGK